VRFLPPFSPTIVLVIKKNDNETFQVQGLNGSAVVYWCIRGGTVEDVSKTGVVNEA